MDTLIAPHANYYLPRTKHYNKTFGQILPEDSWRPPPRGVLYEGYIWPDTYKDSFNILLISFSIIVEST